jgi:hypothetical protein
MELPAHVLRVVQVSFTSVSNKGNFTLEAETVFYLTALELPWRDRNMRHGTTCVCVTCSAN